MPRGAIEQAERQAVTMGAGHRLTRWLTRYLPFGGGGGGGEAALLAPSQSFQRKFDGVPTLTDASWSVVLPLLLKSFMWNHSFPSCPIFGADGSSLGFISTFTSKSVTFVGSLGFAPFFPPGFAPFAATVGLAATIAQRRATRACGARAEERGGRGEGEERKKKTDVHARTQEDEGDNKVQKL
eukprot:TRINITY_DN40393_c0_g1_i1.p1 TRINITY_DN40393_c0_g1~~TRINITY_DN40393_c0_g1_i1.p1  ORF type:complete len:207 (-),score=5.11 TRINITY_DN40393_c0_g1_i1:6-554(-)